MNLPEILRSGWGDVVSEDRNQIVFEQRNKLYGAYQIRRRYDHNVIMSFLLTAGIVISFILIYAMGTHQATKIVENIITDGGGITITNPPPPIQPPRVQPPPSQPPSRVDILTFTTTKDADKDTAVYVPKEPIKPEKGPTGPLTTLPPGKGDSIPKTIIPPENKGPKPVLQFVEKMPKFVGGDEAYQEFLDKSVIYPSYCRENGIEGSVFVNFVVNEDGSISDVEILRGGDHRLEAEAMRVIKSMPKWHPGIQNGTAVRVLQNQRIKFVLRNN